MARLMLLLISLVYTPVYSHQSDHPHGRGEKGCGAGILPAISGSFPGRGENNPTGPEPWG